MAKPRREYPKSPLDKAGLSFFWQPSDSATDYLGRNITGDISMLRGVENATGIPLVFNVGTGKAPTTVTGLAYDDTGEKSAMQLAGELAAETGRVSSADAQARLASSKGFPKSPKGREHRLQTIRSLSNLAAGQRSEGVKQFAGYMADQDASRKADILHKMGIIDEKQAKLISGQAIPADEIDAKAAGIPWAGSAQWLKDMPVQQHLAGVGLAAAGVGAGSVALANMLMQQGQQQTDYNAYAQAVQAMNQY